MIELLFVIIILGIVSSIASELIAKVYSQYILQRAQHRASIKTELAAQQIANRLAAAIPNTIVRRDTAAGALVEDITIPLTLPGEEYHVLQWVGEDLDSFSATAKPGWSGFIDLGAPINSKTTVKTPGSQLLTTAAYVITALNGGAFPSTYNLGVFFPADSGNTHEIDAGAVPTDTQLGLIDIAAAKRKVKEHYKIAWTSYALSVEGGNLYLYYKFKPSIGANIPTGDSSKRIILLHNVSTFKFMSAGQTIRFKICKEEEIGEDFNVTSCKEKVVF